MRPARARGELLHAAVVLALLTVATAPPEAQGGAPAEQRFSLESRLSARAGASAGHVWVTPFAFALPGGGAELKLRWRSPTGWTVDSRAALSLGVDQSGTLGGGYRGNVGVVGDWYDAGWSSLSTRSYVGLSSLSLIPIPGAGTSTTLTFVPVRLDGFRWIVSLDATLELLVIVPRFVLGASTAVLFDLWDFSLGIEAGGAAEAVVAVAANVVSATAGLTLVMAYRF